MKDDTISRQAAMVAITERMGKVTNPCGSGEAFWEGLCIARSIVGDLPSAQPEIIRCKDCKYNYGLTHNGEFNPNDIVCAFFDTDGMQCCDFCSYAERREG